MKPASAIASGLSRADIAALIERRISANLAALKSSYATSGPIPYVVIDDLLPEPLAHAIAGVFPSADELTPKHTLREKKYVSSQMDRFDPLLEEALFAFHDPKIVSLAEQITDHPKLHADAQLYAGGISRMERGCFLNPHIDNSHNRDRTLWRSLNLLYYVSPGWQAHSGGNLELWPHGVKDAPITVESRFNRLVIMATHHHSLHSVSKVHGADARNCISNYFFSPTPMRADQPFHITAFRGRPEQHFRDVLLRADAQLRMTLRRIKSGGFFSTGHWYKR